jgi:hypothetical protein
VTVQFIGSEIILACECALLDLDMADVRLFSGASLVATEDGGGRQFGEAKNIPRVEF